MQSAQRITGFTLIELLVVITIIVVLLALLTPALDKAIYQAELSVCAARQRAVGMASINYASANRRWFPHRPMMSTGAVVPNLLVRPAEPQQNRPAFDDRPKLRGYMNLNAMLNDPLLDPIDAENSLPDSQLEVPYFLWFGWKYGNAGGGKNKMGDRVAWKDNITGVDRRYRALVSDQDSIFQSDQQVFSAHPDKNGVMFAWIVQDELAGPKFWTVARWMLGPASTQEAVQGTGKRGVERGDIDTNVMADDGSVERYNDIAWADWRDDDSPMDNVGWWGFSSDAQYDWIHLPRY